MRILLIPLIAATPALCAAQQVVAGGGGHHANASSSISYTIGEPVIATASVAGTSMTQGFQQPWVDIGTMVDDQHDDGPMVNVYPNPVRHTLHIAIDDVNRAKHYFLHDAAGRLVTDGRIGDSITELDMEPYASGSYVLRVLGADDTTMKSFKISVTH